MATIIARRLEWKHSPGPWHDASPGNRQGLIIDDATGDNIAVAYDKRNAKVIAAATLLLEVVAEFMEDIEAAGGLRHLRQEWPDLIPTYQRALEAYFKATEE